MRVIVRLASPTSGCVRWRITVAGETPPPGAINRAGTVDRVLAEVGRARMRRHAVHAHPRPQAALVGDDGAVRGRLADHGEIDLRPRRGVVPRALARHLLVADEDAEQSPAPVRGARRRIRIASTMAASGPFAVAARRGRTAFRRARADRTDRPDQPSPAGTTSICVLNAKIGPRRRYRASPRRWRAPACTRRAAAENPPCGTDPRESARLRSRRRADSPS